MKIILLLLHLFPLAHNSKFISILIIKSLFTNFLRLLPLLFLLLGHDIPLWRLIYFCLTYPIDKTSLPSLLTYIYFPHFVFFIFLFLVLVVLWLINVVFCKNKILFLRILNRSSKQTFCLFSYQLMYGHFATSDNIITIFFNLFVKLWSLLSFGNICCTH